LQVETGAGNVPPDRLNRFKNKYKKEDSPANYLKSEEAKKIGCKFQNALGQWLPIRGLKHLENQKKAANDAACGPESGIFGGESDARVDRNLEWGGRK
jgi:hypothetical protein